MTLHIVPEPYITREEAGDLLRVSLPAFDRMRKDGERMGLPCPVVTWGRRMLRYRASEVLAWGIELDRRMKEAA